MSSDKADEQPAGTPASFGGRALDLARGFGMRVFVHLASLLAGAATAMSSFISVAASLEAAVCVYIGLICIFARGMARTPAWIVPAAAGVTQTLLLAVSGLPIPLALFWGGAQSWFQRLLHKGSRMGGEWLVLLLMLPLGISLAGSSPLLLPISFLALGTAAYTLLRLLTRRMRQDFPDSIPDVAAEPPLIAHHRAAILSLREKNRLLPRDTWSAVENIAAAADNILQCMLADERDVETGNRFLKRYLPAVHKIVDKHAQLARERAVTPELIRALVESGAMLSRLAEAFAKEHGYLLANDAVDFAAELKVLDTLLKMDGK